MGYIGNNPPQETIPADDTVTTAMLKDDAVTADKLANSINTEITANTTKVTNATHTGDVTGATALTIATDAVDIAMLSATGTASSSTFLRGDNAWASAGDINIRSNSLINGDMRIAQRGTSFTSSDNNDDVYTLDRWLLLSDGNDIVDVTQQSDGGTSSASKYMRLDVETTAKKFGICQVIGTDDCRDLIGQSVSISFDAKVTNASKLSDIRAVVLAWNSTADAVTSDVVSAWGAEGSNPTFATNWTAENTASDLSVTTSWANYKIENISIDTSSATNVAIFIWQNNVATNDTAGIFLEVSEVKLEVGSTATAFEYRPIAEELSLCQRYYEVGRLQWRSSPSITWGGNYYAYNTASFKVTKRATPTIVLANEYTTDGYVDYNTADISTEEFAMSVDSNSGGVSPGWWIQASWTSEAEL